MSHDVTVAETIAVALEHHRAGRLTQAQGIYHQVLTADPGNFDALHLSGVAAHQSGDHAQALALIDKALLRNPSSVAALNNAGDVRKSLNDLEGASACFRKALAIQPDYFEALNNLGSVLMAQRHADEAVAYYQQAVRVRPDLARVQHTLGMALKLNGDVPAAMRAFGRAWSQDPMFFGASEQCVAAAAAIARNDRQAVVQSQPVAHHSSAFTSIVICSIDDAKHARATALYERLYQNIPHEIIVIRDARSLAEAYNRAIAASAGEIVVLSHDDIDILASDFAARLQNHLQEEYDIVGVIGATKMTGPAWGWSGHPHLRGWITHHDYATNEWFVDVVSPQCVVGNMTVLDGVFLAANRAVFDVVQFDAEMFDGFHLYDIDWSYRAAMAGFRLGVAGDLLLVHESRGRFDPAWERYAERLCAKHAVGETPAAPHRQVFEALLDNAEQVQAFFDHLRGIENVLVTSDQLAANASFKRDKG